MVKNDSIIVKEKEVKFIVTDFKNEINVIFLGLSQIFLQKEKEWLLKVFKR